MKNVKVLTFILVLLTFPYKAASQINAPSCIVDGINWCDSSVRVPYDIFPIQGFTFGSFWNIHELNRWKKYGLNSLHAPAPADLDKGAKYLTNGMFVEERFDELVVDKGRNDPAFNGTSFVAHYGGWFQATDTRFFLASNEAVLSDDDREIYDVETRHNWKQKPLVNYANLEAKIALDASLDSLGYILRDLDSYAQGLTYLDGPAALGYYTIAPQAGKAICDFIYRFEASQLESYGNIDTLLQIEYYYYHKIGSNVIETHAGNSYVRKQDFTNYVALPESQKNEHKTIYSFPDTTRLPRITPLSPQSYAPSRHVFTWPTHDTIIRIDCRVKRLVPVDIYVRGLRIRSELADKILKGDSAVVARINFLAKTKKDSLVAQVYNGVSSWSKVKMLTAGNEPMAPSFRAIAEVDRLVKKKIGKHIIPFISNNFPLLANWSMYRSIYEDQVGVPPLAIEAENLEMFYKFWNTPYPKDGIKAALYDHPDVVKGALLPLTGDANQGSDAGTYPIYTYDLYTRNMQNVLDSKGYVDAALAAYPQYTNDPKKHTPWRAQLSSIVTIKHPTRGEVPAADTMRKWLFENVYDTVCIPFSNAVWKASEVVHDSFFTKSFKPDYRSPLSSELRVQLWNALCFGAKGISFNTLTSDGGHNIGIMPFDGAPIDYDLTGTRMLTGPNNVFFGTCDDPYLGPQRYPGEPWRFKDHMIQQGTANVHRFIPIFSPVQFTYGAKTLHINDPIETEDITGYIWYLRHQSPDSTNWKIEFPVDTPWVPFMQTNRECDTTVWAAYDKALHAICPVWYSPDRYPYRILQPFALHILTYYGFAERLKGMQRVIDDVVPIAKQLKEAKWKAGLSYSDMFLTDTLARRVKLKAQAITSFSKFPIRFYKLSDSVNRTSQRVDPDTLWQTSSSRFTTTTTESPDSSYFQLGMMGVPNDTMAFYVAVANRRSWPMLTYFDSVQEKERIQRWDNSGTTPNALRGAVDARRFNFFINTTVFPSLEPTTYFNVTNLRTGEEWIKKATDTIPYSIFLEPGEGTLLKITPARSHIAGLTSNLGMAYNNGHRIAEIIQEEDERKKIMTWERSGDIEFTVVNNPTATTQKNFVVPDSGKVLDNSGRAINPSIAAKGDTVAIVYNFIDETNGGRPVIFVRSVWPFHTWTADTLDRVPIGTGIRIDHLVTPSVTPAIDGFFVSWSTPSDGVKVRLVRGPGVYLSPIVSVKSEPLSRMSVFPSVGSRNESSYDSTSERLHLAFEEQMDDTTSHIYYKLFTHDLITNELDSTKTLERVSRNAPSCEHHHPNIAVSNEWNFTPFFYGEVTPGQPIVTWEMIAQNKVCDSVYGYVRKGTTYVMLRERSAEGFWGSFNAFYPKQKNLPLPLIQTAWNFGAGNYSSWRAGLDQETLFDDATRRDVSCLVFQDTVTKEVHLQRLFFECDSICYLYPHWDHTKLFEQGQYPNLALPYVPNLDKQARTFTFRGVAESQEGLYAARITAREYKIEKPVKSKVVHSFEAKDTLQCEVGLRVSVGGGSVGDSLREPPRNRPEESPASEDSLYRREINWRYKEVAHCNNLYVPPGEYDPQHPEHSTNSNGWPITEDTIRTDYFAIEAYDFLTVPSIFVSDHLPSIQNMMDTNSFVQFDLVLKDSASGIVWLKLDSMRVTKMSTEYNPCNMETVRLIKFDVPTSDTLPPGGDGAIPPPPSGSGYLTLIATKDAATPLALIQTQLISQEFDLWTDQTENPGAFKTTAPTENMTATNPVELSVYPNPFNPTAVIKVKTTKGLPTKVELFDLVGKQLHTFFEGEAGASDLSFTLDGTSLASGSYYVRVVSGSEIATKRVTLNK